MNPKFLLRLVAVPTLASSVLAMSLMPGFASAKTPAPVQASCDAPAPGQMKSSGVSLHKGNVRIASSAGIPINVPPAEGVASADFTAAESDAAVTLFGCDCPSCIGALRQLQAQSLSSGSGHCWTMMQQRVSPEEARSVLQTLEVEQSK
jgi:hypothetical protein